MVELSFRIGFVDLGGYVYNCCVSIFFFVVVSDIIFLLFVRDVCMLVKG